jgi:hypothetical protein
MYIYGFTLGVQQLHGAAGEWERRINMYKYM